MKPALTLAGQVLATLAATFPPDLFSDPGDVHRRKEGFPRLGEQLAESIGKYGLAKTEK